MGAQIEKCTRIFESGDRNCGGGICAGGTIVSEFSSVLHRFPDAVQTNDFYLQSDFDLDFEHQHIFRKAVPISATAFGCHPDPTTAQTGQPNWTLAISHLG